jgi:hypothetical protein
MHFANLTTAGVLSRLSPLRLVRYYHNKLIAKANSINQNSLLSWPTWILILLDRDRER